MRFRAPGRVNLMGDHTDYNEGFVLPCAIELECMVDVERRGDAEIHARSQQLNGDTGGWPRYVTEVAAVLGELGRPSVGADIDVTSSVPIGSGLASSAALEVACALALCAVADFELPPHELALACQRGEQRVTGVPSGIMDQLASLCGVKGAALLIDCRDFTIEPIAVPDELAILIVHSGIRRTLARTAYAERRAACEELAGELGLHSLRDATWKQVRSHPLGRHVVSENERVHATARALAVGNEPALGRFFEASHASLRDDYRVSTPELDALVDALVGAGAIGARLTGAGFGGAVVALARRERAEAILGAAAASLDAWVTRPAAGAGAV